MSEVILFDAVEITPKSNSKCDGCFKKIKAGEPRLRVRQNLGRFGYGFRSTCYRCALERLGKKEKQLKEELVKNKIIKKEFIKLRKVAGKVILANELVELNEKKDDRTYQG